MEAVPLATPVGNLKTLIGPRLGCTASYSSATLSMPLMDLYSLAVANVEMARVFENIPISIFSEDICSSCLEMQIKHSI
jgi:hypothetical protein